MKRNDTEHKLLSAGIWFTIALGVISMGADLVIRPPLRWLTLVPVYCLAAFTLLHSLKIWNTKQALWFLVLGMILPYIAEYLGTNFGAIFGSHWFVRLRDVRMDVGVMLPGGVPLHTVFTWYVHLYLVFLTAIYLLSPRPGDLTAYGSVPIISALLITLWQLSAAPVAINRGFIGFAARGFYHGIPLSNFAGWFATTLFITLFFQNLEPGIVNAARFYEPHNRTALFPIGMFGISLLYHTLLCFRMQLTGAAWLNVAIILLFSLALAIRAKSPTGAQLEAAPALK